MTTVENTRRQHPTIQDTNIDANILWILQIFALHLDFSLGLFPTKKTISKTKIF
jgi:hypothetical protein